MKKFDRLPPEQRKSEICAAALELFNRKGFSATTMENIVERVSLSKGGVYRLYSSTDAILTDLMLEGMRMRNAYYAQQAEKKRSAGEPLTLEDLVEMIGDSLLMYPEFSAVYVEFLWEKRRNPRLQALYEDICKTTAEETASLIRACGAEELLSGENRMPRLTELMNGAILSLQVLDLWGDFAENKAQLCRTITALLNA